MAFSIRLTEDERRLAESYAKIHSYSLSEAFKRALFEKIEDEYRLVILTLSVGHRSEAPLTAHNEKCEAFRVSASGWMRMDLHR